MISPPFSWFPGIARWLALVLLALGCGGWSSQAQTGDAFEKSSLAWRTALHFDPGAEAPLRSLTDLYQREGSVASLLALYSQHVTQYPQDEGAVVVLARLYVMVKDPQAAAFVEEMLKKLPDSALLWHVKAGLLAQTFDPRSIESLDAAVRLETKVPTRRAQWLGELVKAASGAGRDDLVAARLKALASEQAFSPMQRVQWARRCLEAGLKGSALAVLEKADFSSLSGEDEVEAKFVQARVAWQNDHRAEASVFARVLLELLAPDHWRRKEALQLHWQTADEKVRAATLKQAADNVEAVPTSEAAALAYGDLLMLSGKREEAVLAWQKSLGLQPASRLLEERIFEGLENTRREDDLLSFLTARIQAQPEREDLRLRQARLLLQLGRTGKGMGALDELLAGRNEGQRISIRLQTARWLRLQNLFGESAVVLEAAMKEQPSRWDVRKELAEVYILLRREADVEKLLDLDMGDEVSPEVRLEVVQFMISRKLWPQARRHLEAWLSHKPQEFDARLLLARVEALAGRQEAAEKHLEECRKQCDTEARYAAWLNAAWERATELEMTESLVQKERARLWPTAGEKWDAPRLQKLSTLAEQTMQEKWQAEAEGLLRTALADATLPAAAQQELRLLLISVLDGREDQRKALETEIQAALKEQPADISGDLRLRLALMYFEAKRLDLVRSTLRDLDVERCEDATLLQRGLVMTRQLQEMAVATAMARRLVHLQPDEKAHWLAWTSMLAEEKDESSLRLALREMRARASTWKLGEAGQETLRRHLAASAWRTIAQTLADSRQSTDEALLCLEDLEQTELQPQRRLWLAWVRGQLALRRGDAASLADARAALGTQDGWLMLPDGMSLSLPEARRMLDAPAPVLPPASLDEQGDYTNPGELAWSFSPQAKADFQSWTLTPDGQRMIAQDSQSRFYAVDCASGRLQWQRRLNADAAPVAFSRWHGGGGEQVAYPAECCANNEFLCVLRETGLVCLRVEDGALAWQVRTPEVPSGSQGVLAGADERVLWWRAAISRLEAYSMATGKLLWSTEIPALEKLQPINPNHPFWLVSGIHRDGDHVMVWGQGTALLRVTDGTLIWKASLGQDPLTFPLQLDESPASISATASGVPILISSGSYRNWMRGRSGTSSFQLSHVLATPSYGYPGMYGSNQGSPWLQWGGDGGRWLQGDGVWLMGSGLNTARYSVLGFPVTGQEVASSGYRSGIRPLGVAGRGLIVVADNGLTKYLPDGSSAALLAQEVSSSTPSQHPLPVAAMDGSTVVLSTSDEIRALDALSGETLWTQRWSGEAAQIQAAARESLKSWQSMRWSSRGLALYDGRGRTLMLDWRALMARGRIMVPAGTRALLCLRCPQGGVGE